MIKIRSEISQDIAEIRKINCEAFGRENEANLVDRLRTVGKATISLVAVFEDQIAGHILFSPIELEPSSPNFKGVGLGPIAVLPKFQRNGFGSELIRVGIDLCRKENFEIVVLLGDPKFYKRFGFLRASDLGLISEFGGGDHFMAMPLKPDLKFSGTVKYRIEFRTEECT